MPQGLPDELPDELRYEKVKQYSHNTLTAKLFNYILCRENIIEDSPPTIVPSPSAPPEDEEGPPPYSPNAKKETAV